MLGRMHKTKSITFRCSEAQYRRLENHKEQSRRSRTELMCEALDTFLSFAERNRHLNLFELVAATNDVGRKAKFEDEA